MTLSLDVQNSTHTPAPAPKLNVLVHHDQYEKPESGATLRVGTQQVHLTGDETITLGTFLVGGHAGVEALDV